jgi:hypothetical protein
MWLTPEELATLTGYKLPAYQRRYLEREHIRHRVNSKGRVIVAKEDVLGTRRVDAVPTVKRFSFEGA